MTDKLWKQVERYVAKVLGGKRVPILGRAGRADVECTHVLVEVKERRATPFAKWVYEGLAQASLAHQEDPFRRLPLVWVHHCGNDHRDDIIVMRAEAFIPLYLGYTEMVEERRRGLNGSDR